MAAIHLLELTAGILRVACHVAVPDGPNAAGIPWSDVLVQAGRTTPSVLPQAEEADALATGLLVELVREARPDPAMDAVALQAHYREVYAGAQAALAELLASLQSWGGTVDLDAPALRVPDNPQLPTASRLEARAVRISTVAP